jgi:predicted nuclease of predicted toxin-antitoxin system
VRLVADESVDGQTVGRLRALGHDVLFVAEFDPGVEDDVILGKCHQSSAMLLTADKDFGELVFRRRLLHSGVLLLRLPGLTPNQRADLVGFAIGLYGETCFGRFAVLSERALRIRRDHE